MTIAVVYETIEGQTGKIAAFVQEQIRKSGQEVRVINAADKTAAASFDGVTKVILAAPVHERRHPKAFEVFVAASRNELATRDTLMISVSLSAAFPEGLEEAGEYLVEMEMRTGFTPDAELLVAGAVRPSGYDYFQQQVIRHAVLGERDYDLADGEHEFTDWDALARDVAAFLEGAAIKG